MILKLIFGNIKGNKKKTISSVIGIGVSVMLIFVTLNAYVSFQDMRLKNAYDAYGKYNIVLHEVDMETCNWIRQHPERYSQIGIEKIIASTDSGITILESGRNSTEMNGYKLTEGRFPEQTGETAISASARLDDEYVISKYSVGDTIKLDGTEYTISGFLDDYDYTVGETYKIALIISETNTNRYNAYLHFDNKREYQRAVKEIKNYLGLEDDSIFRWGGKKQGFLSGYSMIINDELNVVELDGEGGLSDVNIGRMLLFFAVVLILTSVILGLHIFASYLHGRNKQQGILVSLGFSNGYVSYIYFMECLILVVAGCLVGIVSGRYVTELLFECIQNMRVSRLENFEPQFTRQSFVISIGISLVGFIGGLVPVILRNMNAVHEVMKSRRSRKYAEIDLSKQTRKHITAKYFRKDSYPFEKVCIYMSMIMIGISCILLLCVHKYMYFMLINREEHEAMFDLISDDVSNMDGFETMIPGVTYYDMVYDTMGVFHVERDNINENCMETITFEEDSVPCEIVGVSELQYKNKIELSDEMTYEEFANSGGAIVIDNYLAGDERILKELPASLKYDGRDDKEWGISYKPGEVKIIGRSEFKNWNDQRGISIIVTDEMFKEKFDYTNVMIRINVKDGYEIEAAEMLNKCAFIYDYSFHDYATEYIREQDNKTTVLVYTYGVFAFVMVMNLFVIIYTNITVFMRRRRNISILKTLGHSDVRLLFPVILEVLSQSITAAIISVFISTAASKRLLPDATQRVIFTNGAGNILLVLSFILITQIIAVAVIFVRLRKHKIIYDLR